MSINYITSKEINQWAQLMTSQSELPKFIEYLIRGSIGFENIIDICFPSDDSVQSPGADGRLDSRIGTTHIPKGYSVWEFSNENGHLARIGRKADKALFSRTNKCVNYIPNKSSFIFLTGRKISSKNKWEERNKNKLKQNKDKTKIWRKIKFYDSDDLVHWLEFNPANAFRIAIEILKKYPKDIDTLENFGNRWCINRECIISHNILLHNREEETETLKRWLEGEPKKIKISASRIDEVIAFVWAVIKSLDKDKQEMFFSNSLIVDKFRDFNNLIENQNHQVLIYKDTESCSINYATKSHHVIIPFITNINKNNTLNGTFRNPNDFIFDLKPLSENAFMSIFAHSRFEPKYCESLFQACNGHLGILKEILN